MSKLPFQYQFAPAATTPWVWRCASGLVLILGVVAPETVLAQAPFVDVTASAGLPMDQPSELNGIGGNLGVLDIDLDGRLDLVLSVGQSAGVAVYRNVGEPGNPQFVEETVARGLSGVAQTTIGIAIGDFDNNGWDDLFLANIGTNELFFNNRGVFSRVTETHLEGWSGFFTGVAVGDLDVDGDLDLVVPNYIEFAEWPFHRGGRDLVLLNDGAGRFTDMAGECGAENSGAALSAAITDMDGDGIVDIVVANDFGPLRIPSVGFRNLGLDDDGNLRFLPSVPTNGVPPRIYGMGIARIDFDNDGLLDAFFTSIGRTLWLSGQNGQFWGNDVTDTWGAWTEFGADYYRATWAPVVADLNGDGREDLWIRAGQMISTWFLYNGPNQPDIVWSFGPNSTVDRIEAATLGALPEAGRGAVAADIDGDGRVDLWMGSAHDGPLRLLRGTGSISTLAVQLDSTVSAPGAPGARFWIHCGGSTSVRGGTSGGAFGSSGPPGRWWLARPAACASGGVLEVVWPSGVRSKTPFGADVLALNIEEPRWWWKLPETESCAPGCVALKLTPPAKNGLPVGSGATVMVGFFGDEPVVASDLGTGEYLAMLDVAGRTGSLPLRVVVNDNVLAAHPVIQGGEPALPTMVMYPKFLRKLSPSNIYVTVPGATDLGLSVSGGIFLIDPGSAPDVLSAKLLPMDNATQVTVSLTQNGVSTGAQWQVPVYPTLDLQRTKLVINSPYLINWSGNLSPIQLTLWPRDVLGNPLGGETFPVRVYVDGNLLVEQSTSPWSSSTQVVIPLKSVYDGAMVSVTVGDDEVVTPVPIVAHDYPDQWLLALDPERSDMGLGFATCRAGGDDHVTVVFRPRDSAGHLLPISSVPSLLSVVIQGIGPVDLVSPWIIAGSHIEGVFRCPQAPGIWTAELWFDGMSTGVTRTLVATTVPNLEPIPQTCAVSVYESNTGVPTTTVRLGPRTSDGDRTGSGLSMALWEPESQSCLPVPYCGLGDYCLTLNGCCSVFRRAEIFADGKSLRQFVNIPPGPYTTVNPESLVDCGQDVRLPDDDIKQSETDGGAPDVDVVINTDLHEGDREGGNHGSVGVVDISAEQGSFGEASVEQWVPGSDLSNMPASTRSPTQGDSGCAATRRRGVGSGFVPFTLMWILANVIRRRRKRRCYCQVIDRNPLGVENVFQVPARKDCGVSKPIVV